MQIDAVITWVDSSDEEWRSKINQYLDKKINWEDKVDSTRYNSINEIEIAITSIIKYASFIRNIYLVTDNQKPNKMEGLIALAEKNNITLKLIDHQVIFRDFEKYLPTFNSCSIISALYRIPELSEYFIVFNDDTFLMRKTVENDYFRNGKPVIRGEWRKFFEDRKIRNLRIKVRSFFTNKKKQNSQYKLMQQNSAKILGFTKYIKRHHTPVPIKKSVLENFFNENPDFFENNIKYRFRDSSQFIISSLSNHLQVKNDDYILEKNLKLTYSEKYNLFYVKRRLLRFDSNKNNVFVCFQSLETAPKKTLFHILKWIDKKLDSNFVETL